MKETVSDEAHEVRWGVDCRGKVQRTERAISDFKRGPGWWTSKVDEECVL